MILKLFFVLLAFWVARLMLRTFLPKPSSRRRPGDRPPRPSARTEKADEPLRDLTRQKITDADFEELPPEE
jgi:hypothetical protein